MKNKIETIELGTQKWAAKNLAVTTFRNGDPIPVTPSAEEWLQHGLADQPACCIYDNSKAMLKYGMIYNGYAAKDPRGIAPEGFRLPRVEDILELARFLGHDNVPPMPGDIRFPEMGLDLRSVKLWKKEFYSFPGTNKSGLDFLPTGYRTDKDRAFLDKGRSSHLWLLDEKTFNDEPRPRLMQFHLATFDKGLSVSPYRLSYGCSIRLIAE
jgi:uncharacterized protein (TIGR02145 family)